MAQITRRITYRGNPAFASMLVQMLEQESVTVKWEPPREERGMAELAPEVTIHMAATGDATAIGAAAAKFRKHMNGRAEATIDKDQMDDDED
jgi:hypothetical protein